MEKIRLQKILARAGYGSRRGCEEIISSGKVTVNGEIAKLGCVVNSDAVSYTHLTLPRTPYV